MSRSYLFFDIECANCFDGNGKMCSFGYVITDDQFNILDSQDVVMNPEAEFDWYLFSKKNECALAYSKDYFRMQHNFEAYHTGIKKLMEAPERKILGFSVSNDIGFLLYATERYDLTPINYSAFDMETIINQAKNEKKGLKAWCEYYKIDLSKLTAHNSRDDAMMTMLLAKAFCEEQNTDIESLLQKNKGIRISVEKYIQQREERRYIKEISEKIKDLFGKKTRALLSHKLGGKNYAIGFKLSDDIDEAYRIANLVYKHDGMLLRNIKSNGILIVREDISDEKRQELAKRNISTITIDEFDQKVRLE